MVGTRAPARLACNDLIPQRLAPSANIRSRWPLPKLHQHARRPLSTVLLAFFAITVLVNLFPLNVFVPPRCLRTASLRVAPSSQVVSGAAAVDAPEVAVAEEKTEVGETLTLVLNTERFRVPYAMEDTLEKFRSRVAGITGVPSNKQELVVAGKKKLEFYGEGAGPSLADLVAKEGVDLRTIWLTDTRTDEERKRDAIRAGEEVEEEEFWTPARTIVAFLAVLTLGEVIAALKPLIEFQAAGNLPGLISLRN